MIINNIEFILRASKKPKDVVIKDFRAVKLITLSKSDALLISTNLVSTTGSARSVSSNSTTTLIVCLM